MSVPARLHNKQEKMDNIIQELITLSRVQTWNKGQVASSKALMAALDAQYKEFVHEFSNLMNHQEREESRRELAFHYQRMRELGFTPTQIAEQEQLPLTVINSLLAMPI